MAKTKVLWLSDFNCATGFATVAHNIIDRLQATGKYEFTVIGINHFGEPYDYQRWPFPVYPARHMLKIANPAYQDVFGRQRLLDMLGTGEFDVLFTLQDTFVIEQIAKQVVETRKELVATGMKPFSWIFYYPIDSDAKKSWIQDSAALADFPVTYTDYAKKVTQAHCPSVDPAVIYHGVNLKDFYPLPADEVAAFRKEFFRGQAEGKFLVTNVNRNQRRKDIPRTIAAFAEFHRAYPDTLLYLHMRHDDVGGNVVEMAKHFGLELGKDYILPRLFQENAGLPVAVLNQIYNASDVVISTTLGEGWGLSSTEAMATKTPVIFPNNTSLPEILGNGARGTLVDCGQTPSDFTCLGSEDMEQFRPVTSVSSLVNALVRHKEHPEEYEKQVERAYDWVQTITWDAICTQWEAIFDAAAAHTESTVGVNLVNVGRNDQCPSCAQAGVTRKWKKCRAHNADLSLLASAR